METTNNQQPDTFYVYAAKYGVDLDQRIDYIDWKKYKFSLVLNASAFPRHWFAKNNYLHEFAIWHDGTWLFSQHSTKVGMFILPKLVCLWL